MRLGLFPPLSLCNEEARRESDVPKSKKSKPAAAAATTEEAAALSTAAANGEELSLLLLSSSATLAKVTHAQSNGSEEGRKTRAAEGGEQGST